jgi:putative N6-adenine-specific DNA methylase
MNRYFATVGRGLESFAAQELEQLGAQKVTIGFCGVEFEGDLGLLYRVNLWSRICFRVLWTLGEFPCESSEDLYRGIQAMDWEYWLPLDRTFAVDATGKTPQLNHSHFTALQVKNALVDWQRQQWGDRGTVDTENPQVRLNVHLHQNHCTVSLDSSGSSLHRRGYRPAVGVAPLKETLAAALIQESGWQGTEAFFDPLCGSGTLPLEAALVGLRIAPGSFRPGFGFETWPNFDGALWEEIVAQASAGERESLPQGVGGSDGDPQQIELALTNAQRSGLSRQVQFSCRDLRQVQAPCDRGIVMCNPPYGHRLGDRQQLGAFYQQLGQVLKTEFKGWKAYVLSGNRELSQRIGLRSSRRISVLNGTIPCQFLEYELFR